MWRRDTIALQQHAAMNLRTIPQMMPKRYIVSLLGFFGLVHTFILRTSLSIAIVAMVQRSENSSSVGDQPGFYCSGEKKTIGCVHLDRFRLGFEKPRIHSFILLLRICSRSASSRISGDESRRETTVWPRHRYWWSADSLHAGMCSLGKRGVAHRSNSARNQRGK